MPLRGTDLPSGSEVVAARVRCVPVAAGIVGNQGQLRLGHPWTDQRRRQVERLPSCHPRQFLNRVSRAPTRRPYR
jgi:hypothetical protein